MKNISYIFIILFFLLQSCAVKKTTLLNDFQKDVNLSVLNNHFVGVSLVDLSNNQNLINYNASRLFIPASNTKLLTYYACLSALGDSVPSIKYILSANNDSLIVWPQADATFLNPKFKTQKVFELLKNYNMKTYLVNGSYKGEKYGYGWSWDDYNNAYQTQISEMPIYGNLMKVEFSKGKTKIYPDLLSVYLCDTSSSKEFTKVKREYHSNNLIFPANKKTDYQQSIPLNMDGKTTAILLADTLLATESFTKEVKVLPLRSIPLKAKLVYNEATDTVVKYMLQESDNFLAEQLLLSVGYKNGIETKQSNIIEFIKTHYLNSLPDSLQWVDGSGLSRLNLNTPHNFTTLLSLIYKKAGEKRAFDVLSAGGLNGTLKNQFKGDSVFVYAKSGTVSNNYSLSGFLIGKSGKRYTFSFMNNNYYLPTKQVRQEVENLLTKWKEVL